MAPHSSTLAWKIPWTEEPGRLQSMVSLRVGHDWATSLSFLTFMHWRRKWQPTPVFLPGENPRGGEAWWATVYGVAQSRTRLKRLSSSSRAEDGIGPRYLLPAIKWKLTPVSFICLFFSCVISTSPSVGFIFSICKMKITNLDLPSPWRKRYSERKNNKILKNISALWVNLQE